MEGATQSSQVADDVAPDAPDHYSLVGAVSSSEALATLVQIVMNPDSHDVEVTENAATLLAGGAVHPAHQD